MRNRQRYKCRICGLNFVVGDGREKVSPEGKALAVLIYGRGKCSYGFIAKLFNVSRTAVLKWTRKVASRLSEPEVVNQVNEMQIDEIRHFITKKNEEYGFREPWIVVQAEPLDGLLTIVLVKPFKSLLKRGVPNGHMQ